MAKKCHVEGCDKPRLKGNRYLCSHHYYYGECATPEIPGGGGLTSTHIHVKDIINMEWNFPPITHLSSKDHSQEELQHFLEYGGAA